MQVCCKSKRLLVKLRNKAFGFGISVPSRVDTRITFRVLAPSWRTCKIYRHLESPAYQHVVLVGVSDV